MTIAPAVLLPPAFPATLLHGVARSPLHKEKVLTPRQRPIDERLLAAVGSVHDLVADIIEQPAHFEARHLELSDQRRRERADRVVAGRLATVLNKARGKQVAGPRSVEFTKFQPLTLIWRGRTVRWAGAAYDLWRLCTPEEANTVIKNGAPGQPGYQCKSTVVYMRGIGSTSTPDASFRTIETIATDKTKATNMRPDLSTPNERFATGALYDLSRISHPQR